MTRIFDRAWQMVLNPVVCGHPTPRAGAMVKLRSDKKLITCCSILANTSLENPHIPPPLPPPPPPAANPVSFHEIQDKGMTNGLENAAGLQVRKYHDFTNFLTTTTTFKKNLIMQLLIL